MAAISYTYGVGNTLEQLTQGTSAPTSTGTIELRIDQTAGTVTDGAFAGAVRPVSRMDVINFLVLALQLAEKDPNLFQQ